MRTRDMEDGQGVYSHGDEVKGMNISLGNEETKTSGHRGGRTNSIEMERIIRSMKKEVRSYKVDKSPRRKEPYQHSAAIESK